MKKAIIILNLAVFIACSCSGQNKNTKEDANKTNAEGYVEELVDDGIEYRKDNIVYKFRDGALTTIEQLDWGGTAELPESWLYIYSDMPKEIIYTSRSGDKSQSETDIKMTLEKTVFNHKHNSKAGAFGKAVD